MKTLRRLTPPPLPEVRGDRGHGTCADCGVPLDALDRFCPGCGHAHDTSPVKGAARSTAEAPPPLPRVLACEGCGASIRVEASQVSYTCPFCESNVVIPSATDGAPRQPPEFVIGFALTPAEASERFRKWLQDGNWFSPGDLSKAAVPERMRGVYLPFWSFSMLANSEWTANIGEHYYVTEMVSVIENGKTVMKAQRVQKTAWWPLSGRRHEYMSGYLVSGSRGLSQAEADRIRPYRLPAMKRFSPDFLAGWACEEYSIDREQALATCQAEFRRLENAATRAFLPGDTASDVHVETEFEHVSSDLLLLPVYLLGYQYGGKHYRFAMNGQTGICTGQKPISALRVAIVAAVVVVAAIVFYLMTAN